MVLPATDGSGKGGGSPDGPAGAAKSGKLTVRAHVCGYLGFTPRAVLPACASFRRAWHTPLYLLHYSVQD